MVRSEKTRQFIIEKTASVFNKKGYTGTYLSDLTNATGLTKGSIYGNFKDKNEVAVEAFRFNYKFQTEQLMLKIEKEDRADLKLMSFLDHFKSGFTRVFENGGCAILNTAVDSDDGNEMLKEEVVAAIDKWVKSVVLILEEGITKGEIKTINTTEFAHGMIAMIEGSIMLAKTLGQNHILSNNIEILERQVDELIIK